MQLYFALLANFVSLTSITAILSLVEATSTNLFATIGWASIVFEPITIINSAS